MATFWTPSARWFRPQKPCLIHDAMDDTQVVTWGDFNRRTNNLARRFLNRHAQASDKVAFYLRNHPAYMEGVGACFKARLTHVNVNYRYVADELWYILDNSDSKIVIYGIGIRRPGPRAARSVAEGRVVGRGLRRHARSRVRGVVRRTRGDRRWVAARHPAFRRRHDLPVYRRHDRHAERRDVGARRSLAGRCRGRNARDEHDCAEEHRRARRERESGRRWRRVDAVLSADARHRALHCNRLARGGRRGA